MNTKDKTIKSLVYKKLALLAGSTLIILIMISVFGYIKMQERQERVLWIQHTLKVLGSMEELKTIVYETGNIQKAFILIERPEYITEYNKQSAYLKKLLQQMSGNVADNIHQKENIVIAEKMINDLINYRSRTISLVQEGKKDQALALVMAPRGTSVLRDFQAHINKMKSTEEKLLEVRLIKEREATQSVNNIILLGTLGGISTLFVFLYLAYNERKHREKIQNELNKSAQVQKAIFNATAMTIISTDINLKINFFNPAAEKLLGYFSDEVLGQTPGIFHESKEVAQMAEILSERFHKKIAVGNDVFICRANMGIEETDQWTFIRKNGERVQVRLAISPLMDTEGNISGYIGVAYDLTKQLEFEDTLRKAKEEALAGTRAKSEFLANMSHEIRTPMNAILGMAELLTETNLDEEQKDYVRIFQSAGGSLLNIINDILDISKIEAGHFEMDHSHLSLKDVVESAVDIMAVKAHQKKLELLVDIEDDIHDNFEGDSLRIRQIILNLLGNAIKFTRAGEVILRISAGSLHPSGKRELFFEVLDTGIGMTEEQVKKLFLRFSQADSSITKEFGGTGLGLNITRFLVEKMEGNIEVQSTLGIGTRFKVKILLTQTEAQEVKGEAPSLAGLSFLIVDDNRTNRLLLKNYLVKSGAITQEAEDGVIAWDVLENIRSKGLRPFDMILIDKNMPELDGLSLAKKIMEREETKNPLLLMLTSDNKPGDIALSRTIGVQSLIVKPILRNDLLLAISKVLQGHVNTVQEIPPVIPKTPATEFLKVLLVDDNEDNRQVIKAFLKNKPFNITEAKNGQEAVIFFGQKEYDIVFMDMQMPVMDGYTAVEVMRTIEANNGRSFTPIVALSAFALKEEIFKSYSAGCNAHLTKPVSKKDLLNMISEMTKLFIENVSTDIEDLLPDYLSNRKAELVKLYTAYAVEDFKTIQSLGHKLAGSAGSYGLHTLTEIGRKIEECGRSEDKTNLALALLQYKLYMKNLRIQYVVPEVM